MLKLAPVFLILSVIAGIYSASAASTLSKFFVFASVMMLFISLLGKRHVARG